MTGKRKPVIREYTVESSRVTDTVRLILLADYHDSDYGAEQELLVDRVAELSPEAVLMAGDMADCLRSHERVQQLTEWLASRYPCYAVSGNHELRTGEWDRLRDAFRSRGVTVLQGQTDELTVRGQLPGRGKGVEPAVGLLPQKEEIGLLFGPAFPPATSGCGISFFRLRTDLLRPCPWRANPPAGADQWAVCTRSGVVSALCWRGLFLGTLHIGG